MPPRTTVTAVKQVMQTNLTQDQVEAFILDANVWVSEEIATSTDPIVGELRLEVIERWLACALVRARDVGLKSATLKDISESYQVSDSVTDYLLRAAGMDPTGKVQRQFIERAEAGSAGFKPVVRIGKGFRDDAPSE